MVIPHQSTTQNSALRLAPYVTTIQENVESGFKYNCKVQGFMPEGTRFRNSILNRSIQTLFTQARKDLGENDIRSQQVDYKKQCDIIKMNSLLLTSFVKSVEDTVRTNRQFDGWSIQVFTRETMPKMTAGWVTKKTDPEIGWGTRNTCDWLPVINARTKQFDIEMFVFAGGNTFGTKETKMYKEIYKILIHPARERERIAKLYRLETDNPRTRLTYDSKGSRQRPAWYGIVSDLTIELVKTKKKYADWHFRGFHDRESFQRAVTKRQRWEQGENEGDIYDHDIDDPWYTEEELSELQDNDEEIVTLMAPKNVTEEYEEESD